MPAADNPLVLWNRFLGGGWLATIIDVAREAGVSRTTTSRVLNDSPHVDPDTRRRVLEAMERLSYSPSPAARRLGARRTWSVDAVAFNLGRPQAAERLQGAEAVINATELDLVIHNVQTVARRDRYLRALLSPQRTDGVLLVSLPPGPGELESLVAGPVPVVGIDVHGPAVGCLATVNGDDVGGGELVARYLVGLGHRRIGFVADAFENPFGFTSSRDRFLGLERVLGGAGIALDTALGSHGTRSARDLAMRLLTAPNPPTAIFAASDTQALGVLSAARDLGLRVPADLSVVGYDDITVAEAVGLTTMRQQLEESGRIGAELLLKRLGRASADIETIVLQPELVIRATAGQPKEGDG